VDTKDESTKKKVMRTLRNYDHPFKPNFWRYLLLNNKASIKENYIYMIENLLV
jgi:hypothetical protein